MSEINLLTAEEKLEQKIQLYTKVANIILGVLLIVTGGIGYYFNTLNQPLILEKTSLETNLSNLRTQLLDYSNEEVGLRNLKIKYDVARGFVDQKVYYEKIIREIYERNTSGGVIIKTISIDSEKNLVSIRVSSDSSSFKRFVDNLKAPQVTETNIKDIFTNSGIPEDVNEVTKEYVVTVKYNKGALDVK